ncbi:MAG: hypothetical protein NTZ33_01540 [Bacteroidetes bacterium]|nr:hypothetical protein [Bacteroidota bacterium]
MKKQSLIILLSVISVIYLSACKCHKSIEKQNTVNTTNTQEATKVIAAVIIYKTNADFYNNVPVMLSDDKTDIISYPDITDVYYNGKLAYPTKLENGYLLDNRGVSKNTAFLKYTYDEYSKLPATPTKDELLKMIISKNAITELYRCNKLPKNNISQLNDAIRKGLPGICENLIK